MSSVCKFLVHEYQNIKMTKTSRLINCVFIQLYFYYYPRLNLVSRPVLNTVHIFPFHSLSADLHTCDFQLCHWSLISCCHLPVKLRPCSHGVYSDHYVTSVETVSVVCTTLTQNLPVITGQTVATVCSLCLCVVSVTKNLYLLRRSLEIIPTSSNF